jgi:hypothetical protein
LKLVFELFHDSTSKEEHLVYLEWLYEHCRDDDTMSEAKTKHVKDKYDTYIHPHVFSKGVLVLDYHQDKYSLQSRKFNPMWNNPYIVMQVLSKEYYELEDCDGNVLIEPHNKIYFNKYYSHTMMLGKYPCTC